LACGCSVALGILTRSCAGDVLTRERESSLGALDAQITHLEFTMEVVYARIRSRRARRELALARRRLR
jgi:hypothetical protein